MANIITALILSSVLGLLGYWGSQRTDIWLKNQAVDECLNSSKYDTELLGENHVTRSQEPNKEWYDFCMKEKGY